MGYSDFLFARPSFGEGMARLVDVGGVLNIYNTSEDPDELALWADWCAVGQDLRNAIAEAAKQLPASAGATYHVEAK